MPSEKTKQLLEGLGNIANKTRITEEKHAVVSNEYGEDAKGKIIYIDRMYGDLFGGHRLIQKNHKEYTGKIHKRRRLIKGSDGNSFYSACYETGCLPVRKNWNRSNSRSWIKKKEYCKT